MSDVDPSIITARAEVDRTRARLIATAREMQDRLSPHTLVRDVWDSAKEKGAGLAEEAVDAVRKRPIVAGGVVTALALFLGRDPLMDLVAKALKSKDDGPKSTKRPIRSAKPRKSAKPRAKVKPAATAKPRAKAKPTVTAKPITTESVE
jgi:Protein of unknown function (DUF3618)